MNKMREYERGREDGLDLARRITREGWLEALEKECRFRGVTGIHTSLARKDLDKASEKIKQLVSECCVIMAIAVLHDEFGFGQKRCQKFMDGMDRGADYLMDDMATWEDYRRSIKEELNLDLRFRING
jgi:hypothetical protein